MGLPIYMSAAASTAYPELLWRASTSSLSRATP